VAQTDRNQPQIGADGLLNRIVRSLLDRESAPWQMSVSRPWCLVSPTVSEGRQPLQGWKLHISATPLSAALVLDRSVPILLRRRCTFKFANTLDDVAALVGREANRSAIGKFLTVYPAQDQRGLKSLAEELHTATLGLPGPTILSDRRYRAGSLIHYRFGAFAGARILGNDGSYVALLVAPDGSLEIDHRKAWCVTPAWAPNHPFAIEKTGGDLHKQDVQPVLLAGRYTVKKAIRHSSTGGVYRACDTRTGDAVVIKRARRHTGCTYSIDDATGLRRHEERILRDLELEEVLPRALDFFEQEDDVFLVEEEVEGRDLRSWAAEHVTVRLDGHWGPNTGRAMEIARQLAECLKIIHTSNLVVRDMSPGNVMVGSDGGVRFVDAELFAKPGEMAIQGFTPGYGSPEQVAAGPVGPALPQTSDLFGLGALFFFIATGTDPFLFPDVEGGRSFDDRLAAWLDVIAIDNATARRFKATVISLMREDPAERPNLETVLSQLDARHGSVAAERELTPKADLKADFEAATVEQLIQDAQAHLLETRNGRECTYLWPPDEAAPDCDAANVQYGSAGPLSVLARAYMRRPTEELAAVLAEVAEWTIEAARREPRSLPGLYFGRSGTAWALLETGTTLGREDIIREAKEMALRVPVDWPNPDICHGLAGAGLAQIRFWEVTGESYFLERTDRIAKTLALLAEREDRDIRWPIPKSFRSGLAGLTHYGFAHGVAGIGTFLLAAGRATGSPSAIDLSLRAADALIERIRETEAGVLWPIDADQAGLNKNWCSGASGIGTFLIRVWGETGDERALHWAKVAADEVHRSRWFEGTCQCHGLSGDAELLLDLDATGATTGYGVKAVDLLRSLYLRDVRISGRRLVADAFIRSVTASYGTGLAGVLALLLRIQTGGDRMWMPDILRPRYGQGEQRVANSANYNLREFAEGQRREVKS
jgi:hypothetical protein